LNNPIEVTLATSNPLSNPNALALSHMGIYVRDLERMARFYKEILGFTETDRGSLGQVRLVFLSRNPNEHHQIVLASGRPEDATYSVINQLSFRVPDLATLKYVHRRASVEPDVSDMAPVCHGNAISIYFRDPEGNRLEVFLDTPWYCEQPVREPIDLSQPDDVIMANALAMARDRPQFQDRADWQAALTKKILTQGNV
jgi:catechol 2,3-dioxygenase